MLGNEIYSVFKQIGAAHLHHANSVKTSCTFLEQGGLLSRAFVEQNGLIQTSQSSDKIDKDLKIWDRIFIDHVDIHERGGRVKGPNQYGPVLFVFKLDFLLSFSRNIDIQVTKLNPIYWKGKSKSERWFADAKEVAMVVTFGNFDKMLVISTANGKLKFPNGTVKIILDDPNQKLKSKVDVLTHAKKRLTDAAKVGGVNIIIEKRNCQAGCICLNKYANYTTDNLEFYFG